MNNKYQKAFERIESLDIWSIPFSTPSSNWGEYLKCGDDIEASYQISEDLEVIKELVDKETPMVPKNREIENLVENGYIPLVVGECGKCDCETHEPHKYCWNCGQKIDWNVD